MSGKAGACKKHVGKVNAHRHHTEESHSIRLCKAERVPFFLSEDWLEWKV